MGGRVSLLATFRRGVIDRAIDSYGGDHGTDRLPPLARLPPSYSTDHFDRGLIFSPKPVCSSSRSRGEVLSGIAQLAFTKTVASWL